MSCFSERLRSEIEYVGLSQKEFAAKADIKKRALDSYLREQQSMPPADVAVKMASALGLTVEYLVTGKKVQNSVDISDYLQFRSVLDNLLDLPQETLASAKIIIEALANDARKKNQTK